MTGVRAQTWDTARLGRFNLMLPGFEGFKTKFIVSDEKSRPAPQAFLIEQNPEYVVKPHTHPRHQFQVVAWGDGSLGRRHSLKPFTVHYTSPDSAYGPLVAGADGLAYFTLRAVGVEGATFVGDPSAAIRRDLPKTQITSEALSISDSGQLEAYDGVAVEAVMNPLPDGAAAWLVRVPKNASVPAPEHPNGGGRFYLVAAGSLVWNDKVHPRHSTLWVPVEEEPFRISAGSDGLEVLVMQFPHEALRV